MNSIFTRRSVRSYTDEPVASEHVDMLLRAGMQAPSAHNQQAWEFVVVTDSQKLIQLANTAPGSRMVSSCQVCIAVLGNSNFMKVADRWEQDMGACTQNILLQACELGLGAVWIGVAPDKVRCDHVAGILDLPNHVDTYCLIAIGHPETEDANCFVDRFNSSRIHMDSYKG